MSYLHIEWMNSHSFTGDNFPKIILEEIREKDGSDQEPIRPTRVASTQDRGEPRRSGRVVTQLNLFIGLKEIPLELETDRKSVV